MSVFSSFVIAHLILTRVTRRMSLVEQEVLTLPIFRGVPVAGSLGFSAEFCFVDHCFSFGLVGCVSFYDL